MSPWFSELFLSTQSDERLVKLARAGHHQAFVAIVQRYRRELLALARRLNRHGRDEDIVQQALLSAFVALQNGTEVGHLRGWLYAIVRNAAARSSTTGPPHADLDEVDVAGEPLEDTILRRLHATETLSELQRLPARQRDALLATAVQGFSREETATALNLSEGAVRQLVHRARATLRTAVTAITPFPLLRCLMGPRTGGGAAGGAEAAASAGAAGGLALKAGALVASGVVATGVVSLQHSAHARRHHEASRTAERAAAVRTVAEVESALRRPLRSVIVRHASGPSHVSRLLISTPRLTAARAAASHVMSGSGPAPRVTSGDGGSTSRRSGGGSNGGSDGGSRSGPDGGSGGSGSPGGTLSSGSDGGSGSGSDGGSGSGSGGGSGSGSDGGSSDGGSLQFGSGGSSGSDGSMLATGSHGGSRRDG